MRTLWNKLITISIPLFASFAPMLGQSDTQPVQGPLQLSDVIELAVKNNPVVKQSGEVVNSSDLAIKLSQSAWLPVVEANGTYSRMAPIPSFDIPGFGHIQMYPDNGMTLSVEARQLLYDFGKTSKGVEIQRLNKEIAGLTTEQIKEKLALASAGIFYSLYYIQSAQGIVQEHVNYLKKHLENVEKKQKTGSATRYEILSTQVKLNAAETQLSELQTAYHVQLSHLNAITGSTLGQVTIVADTAMASQNVALDSIQAYALLHRDDLLLQEKRKSASELNYKLIGAQNNPTLSLFGTGGMKNGYLPEIETPKANYLVGLSLKVPIFEGNRKNIRLQMAQSSLSQANYELESTKEKATDELNENYLQLQLAIKKVAQSMMQAQLAREAYSNAEVNFKEGTITNLDLIYSSDMLSDSELQLLKNKIDYKFSLLKLKAAMGERLYQ